MLDPQMAQVLAEQRERKLPPIELRTPEQHRAFANAARHPAGPKIAGVHDFALLAADGQSTLPARLYVPRPDQRSPVLILWHGGGWVAGSIEAVDGLARTIALHTGHVVLNIGYRLAPEFPFPAALDDCQTAYEWMARHAVEYGGDPSHMAVSGISVGANLAAALCLRRRDAGLSMPKAQLLFYPCLDPALSDASCRDNAEGYGLTTNAMRWFWHQYTAGRSDPYAAPLEAASVSGLPPTLIVTAEYDPVRDDGVRFAKQLAREDVSTKYWMIPGLGHGFLAHFDRIDAAREVILASSNWLVQRRGGRLASVRF